MNLREKTRQYLHISPDVSFPDFSFGFIFINYFLVNADSDVKVMLRTISCVSAFLCIFLYNWGTIIIMTIRS